MGGLRSCNRALNDQLWAGQVGRARGREEALEYALRQRPECRRSLA
jgi:hypothetical protein